MLCRLWIALVLAAVTVASLHRCRLSSKRALMIEAMGGAAGGGRERLHRRALLQNQPETAVPRLQPITHREGSATLAPALQVHALEFAAPWIKWLMECAGSSQATSWARVY